MKSIHLFLAAFFFAIITLGKGCQYSPKIEYDILSFENAESVSNVSGEYLFSSTEAVSDTNPEVKAVASPGDLLYIEIPGCNDELYYRYKRGDSLHFRMSVENGEGCLNDKRLVFNLSDSASWSEFGALEAEVVSGLEYLTVDDSLTDQQFDILEKQKGNYRDMGLNFYETNLESVNRLLSITRPSWIISDFVSFNEASSEFLTQLEVIWLMEADLSGLENLKFAPNLQQLMIWGEGSNSFDLQKILLLKKLNSFTLNFYVFPDTSVIEFPPSIERLHLIACEFPEDTFEIQNLPRLTSLSLLGSENFLDVSSISNLSALTYFAPPLTLSQEDFENVIEDHASLEVIELNECEEITDLSVLNRLTDLRALKLSQFNLNFSQLYELTGLGLLVIDRDMYDKQEEEIVKLQSVLTETDIYPGGGLCLGSGWLILVIPLVILTRYAVSSRKKFIKQREA